MLISSAIDLISQLLQFDHANRLTVPQAIKHPYVSAYHDETDEPDCHAIFDKWEQVESLQTIEELKAAITKEIEEYRAEVRTETVDEGDEIGEGEEEAEWIYDYAEPIPPPRMDDYGPSPRSTSIPLPPQSRIHGSPGPGTPLSVFSDDSSNPSTRPSTAGPHSGRSSRRTSTHSIHPGRRPNSFLFSSGLGAGMTPLSSMGVTPMTTSTSSNPIPAQGGHSRNGSLVGTERQGGRRSRAPSSTFNGIGGDFTSLRPLIRQLSTLGMDGGGERDELGRRVGEVPPMSVGSSDAPPSEVSRFFSRFLR